MNKKYLEYLETWFTTYAESYLNRSPHASDELRLKLDHSLRVRDEMRAITADLECGETLRLAALAAALLHDVGRFPQYVRYGTFADDRSEDHARLGLEVIDEHSLMEPLDPGYATMITFAIAHHNRRALPDDVDEDHLFLARMLRDADKLDIFRVVTGYYGNGDAEFVSAMLGLTESEEISPVLCRDILAGNLPSTSDIASCNDLKLLQMSWVYDLNFPVSLRAIQERKYLDVLRGALPDEPVVKDVYNVLRHHMMRRVSDAISSNTGLPYSPT